jgi:hypothetical protein
MNDARTAGSRVPRRARGVIAGLAWVMFTPVTVWAHPYDVANPPPTDFASAVRSMRTEVAAMVRSSQAGDFADLAQRAVCLDTLAMNAPGFAMKQHAVLADSAAGPILRSSRRLRTTTYDLRRAAGHRDASAAWLAIVQAVAEVTTLEGHVPKQYVCPMHCEQGVVYSRPGACPVCGMHLQLVTSDRYKVVVTPGGGSIRAKIPATLGFRIEDPAGFEVRTLQVVHEKLLHLIMVSYDLSWFAHVHPARMDDGSFRLQTAFPAGGRYVLYHDFTPDSAGMQVVPVELSVEGDEPPPAPLTVDDGSTRHVDGLDVTLTHTPLVPNRECAMTFSLSRRDQPIADLEPFLGAAGHLIMISQDRAAYVHSHPLEATSGPQVTFRMRFERTGLYKAWAQFQRHGRVITVPFVIEVTWDGSKADATN